MKNILLTSLTALLLTGCAFSQNKEYTVVNEADKNGLLANNSTVIVKPIYDSIDKYFDDEGKEFSIVKYNNKFGIINRESKLLLKPIYDSISPFFNGFARIEVNGKVGLINNNFDVVLKPKFEEVEEFYNDIAYIKSTEGLFGCIDKTMNPRIVPQFDRIYVEKKWLCKSSEKQKMGFYR